MSLHPVLNFHVTADDVLHVCPYDSSHQVLFPRLSRHLVKCRTAYLKEVSKTKKGCGIGICKWNSIHHIHMNDLPSHELNCPDRECMTDFLRYHNDPEFKVPGPARAEPAPVLVLAAAATPPPLPTPGQKNIKAPGKKMTPKLEEEDWEPAPIDSNKEKKKKGPILKTGVTQSSSEPPTMYDPTIKLMREPIIYTPQGLTKSELKEHRKLEHLRWQELKFRELVISKDEANENVSSVVEEKKDFD